MQGLRCAIFCTILLCPPATLGSSIFRCEDSNGHVTFTRQGCPDDHNQRLQHADNPTPGSGKPVPLAKPRQTTRESKKKADHTLTVIGVKQDGCGNHLSNSERRAAIIKQQIQLGMSRADVESSLGKPDKLTELNGQTRYVYQGKKGNSRTVNFDEAGCVKGKKKTLDMPDKERPEAVVNHARDDDTAPKPQRTDNKKGPASLQALSIWCTQEDSNLRPLGS